MDKKNISDQVDWISRDIQRWKEVGTIIPATQIKVYEKIRDAGLVGLTVVDIGCSIGVGSNILSHTARHVWGIDINEEAIKFANDMFARPNLGFEVFDIENPPPREYAKFDVVVLSEVIEHLDDPEKALQTMKTFFKDGTVGYINTPNRNAPELDADHPHNELHLKEYRAGELYELLIKHFGSVTLYSVPKLNQWEFEETIDGNSQETPIIAKVRNPI